MTADSQCSPFPIYIDANVLDLVLVSRMQPTVRALAQQASHIHRPLIHFLGKRQWSTSIYMLAAAHYSSLSYPFLLLSEPESPHPHPAAPVELQKSFPDFLKKFESSASGSPSSTSSSSSAKQVYGEFWEAPSWVWKPRVRVLEEAEMDVITVSKVITVPWRSH